jgi:dUTP pyrophosphatase
METISIQGNQVNFYPSEPGKTVIRVKKLTPDAVLPFRSTIGSAAFDLAVSSHIGNHSWHTDPETYILTYGSGLSFEFPENVYGLLLSRSSCYKKKHQLVNGIGLIDQDYRGEVMASFVVSGIDIYDIGERFCQLLIQGPGVNPFEVEFELVQELSETTRGHGGFGSTGL